MRRESSLQLLEETSGASKSRGSATALSIWVFSEAVLEASLSASGFSGRWSQSTGRGCAQCRPGGGATSASPPRGPHRILHNAWLLVAKANLESGAAGAGGSHSGQPATERDDTLTVTSWALCGGPGVALPKRHLVAPEPWGKLLKKGFRGWERLGKAVFSHPAFPSAVRSRKVMARGRSWDQIMFIFA